MKKIQILNLYACLGGNRAKWDEVGDFEITAVELDPELARMYQEIYPNDVVVVADAHPYLLDNFKHFDIIWTSPPCPTHSRARYWYASNYDTPTDAVYPDLKLYEEILFLKHYFKGKYIVENVIPYYEPLIPAQKRGRHLYWTNFTLPSDLKERRFDFGQFHDAGTVSIGKNELQALSEFHGINLSGYKGKQDKIKIGRNLVDYNAGKVILEIAVGITKSKKTAQTEIDF